MPSTYEQRVEWLRYQGLLEFEAYDLADNYKIRQFRELPYLVSFRRWRLSYISRLRNLGYSDRRIINAIIRIYNRHGWTTVFDMIRYFRKQAIDSGGYTPIKKRGSHHKKGTGWSAGDRKAQKARRKAKTQAEQREEYQQKIIRASAEGNIAEMHRLERERNKKFGF